MPAERWTPPLPERVHTVGVAFQLVGKHQEGEGSELGYAGVYLASRQQRSREATTIQESMWRISQQVLCLCHSEPRCHLASVPCWGLRCRCGCC
jgi:hypothetical protein